MIPDRRIFDILFARPDGTLNDFIQNTGLFPAFDRCRVLNELPDILVLMHDGKNRFKRMKIDIKSIMLYDNHVKLADFSEDQSDHNYDGDVADLGQVFGKLIINDKSSKPTEEELDLVKTLQCHKDTRPISKNIKKLPYYLNEHQKMEIVKYINQLLNNPSTMSIRESRILRASLESISGVQNWTDDVQLKEMLAKETRTSYDSTIDSLFRYIRNLFEHKHQKPYDVQSHIGKPENHAKFMNFFFTEKFPKLLVESARVQAAHQSYIQRRSVRSGRPLLAMSFTEFVELFGIINVHGNIKRNSSAPASPTKLKKRNMRNMRKNEISGFNKKV